MTNVDGENDGRTEIADFNVDCEVTGGKGDARLQTRSNAEKTKHIYVHIDKDGRDTGERNVGLCGDR